jgi:serine/threonine protein kinase
MKEQMSSDDYEIGERLGEGAFGKVYKCIDRRDRHTYAMKIIKFNPLMDKKVKERLVEAVRKEIDLLKILSEDGCSQYLTCIHDSAITRSDGDITSIRIVLEYFSGKNLADVVGKIELDARQMMQFALQIFRGLKEMHDHKIAHRDIKLENIMFDREGFRLNIVDVGLSCIEPCNQKITGTPVYFPPEYFTFQHTNEHIAFYAADIYGVGIVLYEMARGFSFEHNDPFTEKQMRRMMRSGNKEYPENVMIEEVDYIMKDRRVGELINRCIKPLPQERFTARDAIRLIEQFLANMTVATAIELRDEHLSLDEIEPLTKKSWGTLLEEAKASGKECYHLIAISEKGVPYFVDRDAYEEFLQYPQHLGSMRGAGRVRNPVTSRMLDRGWLTYWVVSTSNPKVSRPLLTQEVAMSKTKCSNFGFW